MASATHETFVTRTAKNVFSGTVAGVAVCLVGHPFDTLKVRLQTQPIKNPVYGGLTDCFVKTLKWEGLGGLYKGVGSPLVGQMFFRATLFSSYFQVSTILAGPDRQGQRLDRHQYFIAGACTGFIGATLEGPIDLFKTQMQIQIIRAKSGGTVQYKNVFHAGWVIANTQGIRGVYQGLGATWMRNTPANAIYFGFYELLRTRWIPEGGTVNDITSLQQFTAGGVAGFFYWFLTYPTDVVKSAMQSDDIVKSNRKYSNIIDCYKKLYHNEGGIPRFFRGFAPCLMRSVPANATMLFVLEKTRQLVF